MYATQDHTFVIAAYKESPFSEECINSLQKQSLIGNIRMITSTPNDYITSMSHKYNIPLTVNEGGEKIGIDFNFALRNADTPLATICHQYDIYHEDYLKKSL